MIRHSRALCVAFLLAAPVPAGEGPVGRRQAGSGPAGKGAVPAPGVTVIGDVHGDLATFRKVLRSAGLIDLEDRWSGGDRIFVQTGDLLDRGPHSRQVLELLMRLEEEAPAAGGRVVAVLGNHEVMNVTGDLRYTTLQEFAAFREEEDPGERARRKEKILRLVKEGSPLLLSRNYRDLGRVLREATFDRQFPPGYFAHRDAFSPAGRYGSWILERPVVHREGRTLFLHGGLGPPYADLPLEEVNARVKADLTKYLEGVAELERLGVFDAALGYGELLFLLEAEKKAGGPHPTLAPAFLRIEEALSGIAFHEEGPLWYRGLALGDERRFRPLLERILRAQAVDRIVIGHTVAEHLVVKGRFSNRVILIDTGLNQEVYGGRPSALVLSPDGSFRVK